MKKKIILIVLAVLITFGISLGIGYKLSNKNNKGNYEEVNTVKEEDNKENDEEQTKEEIKEDLPIEVDEKSIEKVDKEIKKQEEVKKESTKKNTTNNNVKSNTNIAKANENSKNNTSTSKTTDSNNNNNTNNETTKTEESKPSTPSTPTVPVKTVVSTENKEEETTTLYKYGVNLIEIKTYKVTTYSDGTSDKDLISTKKKYDKSGYNGTTETLKSEAQSVVSSNKAIYQELLGYVNTYRNEVGVTNINLDDKLSLAATIRAMEMAYSGKFAHYRPNGKICFSILNEMGISYYTSGENIAAGQATAKAAATSWRNSKDGHYESMINSDYKKIGIGMYNFNGTKYWVQLFTN